MLNIMYNIYVEIEIEIDGCKCVSCPLVIWEHRTQERISAGGSARAPSAPDTQGGSLGILNHA